MDDGEGRVDHDRGRDEACVDGLDVPTVRADGSRSTAELVDHLVGLGHRRIATIAGPQETITGRERLGAFLGALAAHGLEVPDGHVELGNFQQWSGQAAMRRLPTLPERPTAVFAADNLMALGALQALRAAGLRVPDDMALASFDDLPWFELVDPPITAIAQSTAELGRVAVRALLDVLAGRPARSRLLESRLVVRASCGEQGWPGTSARVSEHMPSKNSRSERG